MTLSASHFRCDAYADRPTTFDRVIARAGWRLKQYTIRNRDSVNESAFDEAMAFALDALPSPATDALRPGVGFVIRHEGATARYLVLCWWDNENELPMRIWVQPTDGSTCWRRAGLRESVCVWDLAVIEHERRAYIAHVLARGAAPDLDGYLGATPATGDFA